MDPEPEVIREDIEETRSNLTEKIEILEKEVIGGVKDAREAVADTVETVKDKVETTVENVKETVQETIQSVKNAFDMRRQMDAHPWVFVGAAAGAGFLLGALVPPPRRLAHAGSYAGPGTFRESLSSLSGGPQGEPRREHGPSAFTALWQQFQPEVQQLKGQNETLLAELTRLRETFIKTLAENKQLLHKLSESRDSRQVKPAVLR